MTPSSPAFLGNMPAPLAPDAPKREDYGKALATVGGAAGSGALLTRFLPIDSAFAKKNPVLRGAIYAGGLSLGGLGTRAGVDAYRTATGNDKVAQTEGGPRYSLFREYLYSLEKSAGDMPPFLKQDRPAKVKEIYRALRRDHPEYSAEKKARIAASMGKSAAVRTAATKNSSLLDKLAEIEYRGRTFPGYNQPIDSDRPEKKKMVLAKKGDQVKLIHFGQKGYKHNYSDAAKKNYLTRSAGIRGKDGSLTANDKLSANYWARRELWPKNEPADGSAKNRTSGKQLEKKAGRPILQYRGQVTDPRWWYLNKKGNPASKTWLKKQREEAVALGESVADARGDYGRPFGRTESHLHGAKGSEGIHFYGTLSDARNALKSAKRGNSTLKEASFKIASSDDDLGHGMELAGLGILAVPPAIHLGAKIPGVRKAAKPLSVYLKENHAIEDAVDLGGLGVLGVPAIKHFMDKRKKEKSS
jgi:hypothetical protein